MRWKKVSNFEVAVFFSIAYTLIAFLDAIGPMHMNASGAMSSPGYMIGFAFGYWLIALAITWLLYYCYSHKSTLPSFIIALIVGIILILAGIFLWAIVG